MVLLSNFLRIVEASHFDVQRIVIKLTLGYIQVQNQPISINKVHFLERFLILLIKFIVLYDQVFKTSNKICLNFIKFSLFFCYQIDNHILKSSQDAKGKTFNWVEVLLQEYIVIKVILIPMMQSKTFQVSRYSKHYNKIYF